MTVHWNPRRGFARGFDTVSSGEEQPDPAAGRVATATLLQAMGSLADSRPAVVEEARRLVASSDYPSEHVLGALASLLAGAWSRKKRG